jgi:hypothetical protein
MRNIKNCFNILDSKYITDDIFYMHNINTKYIKNLMGKFLFIYFENLLLIKKTEEN